MTTRRRAIFRAGAASLGVVAVVASVTVRRGPAPASGGVVRWSGAAVGLGGVDAARVKDNCGFGVPRPLPGREADRGVMIMRDGYVLLASSTLKVALWVCEHATAGEMREVGQVERREVFKPDPLLALGERAELADFAGSGFDRGHLAAAANFGADQRLKDETFYLSNMAPQRPDLNRGAWAGLEELGRAWVSIGGEAFIVSGPVFEPGVAAATIGVHGVGVPVAFFKVLLVRDVHRAPPWRVESFVLVNADGSRSGPWDFDGWRVGLGEIGERVGFDLVPEWSGER